MARTVNFSRPFFSPRDQPARIYSCAFRYICFMHYGISIQKARKRAGEYKAQSGDRALLLHIFVLFKRDLFVESSGLKPSTTHVPPILLGINKGKCAKAKRSPRETEGPLVGAPGESLQVVAMSKYSSLRSQTLCLLSIAIKAGFCIS